MFTKLILWLIYIGIWYLIIRYRRDVKWWTWSFGWAEKYIWNWWTYFVLVLIWMAFIFYWALYPFGWMDLIFEKQKDF